MKKLASILSLFFICAPLLTGCAAPAEPMAESGKPLIVATLFPQYDFARQVAGDRADVRLLLPPGVESHSYEPTPADMILIEKSDLFIYTGKYMEPWAEGIVSNISGTGLVLDISENIALEQDEEEGHDHEHGGIDPHIWTNPLNAVQMVDNLTEALCGVDPTNAAGYTADANAYKAKLTALDQELQTIVSTAKRREIAFGGRFAMHYFAERYGLEYTAAFDSCSSETEPSARVLAQMIDEIREKQIPVIFYEELTDPKVSRAIAGETGVKLLLLHSCHNVSRDELKSGATYLSLMEQNARNLKEGLN